ncbi:hypothetical protein [Streptomyces sp. NPDC057199]|uniref:hypothetical protein n=1 Tax=Streptomyces sp. NPDC057199 TaxID=3346047 RepID=UPI003639916E
MFFQDEVDHDRWHVLRWNGLPPGGEVPASRTPRPRVPLAEVRRRGLAPRSDSELLPVLLELLGSAIPVEKWPTQMAKRERISRSRQAVQTQAARTDRAAAVPPLAGERRDLVLAWPEHAQSTRAAVDAERHQRRQTPAHSRADRQSLWFGTVKRTALSHIRW